MHPVLLTLLPFDTIPIRFLEKRTVSFSSFETLSHIEGADARRAVIMRLQTMWRLCSLFCLEIVQERHAG